MQERMISQPKIIFLMGPTASGKTKIANALYEQLPIELISVDSALIYRNMDIGTAKPSKEELLHTPYRLLDIRDPSEIYSVADFRHDTLVEITDIISKKKIPLLVGGSMLYFKALLEGLSPLPKSAPEIREQIKQMAYKQGWEALHRQLYKIDPVSGARIHPNDPQRISRALEVFFVSGKTLTQLTKISGKGLPYNVIQFAISTMDRKLLHHRIELRFKQMLKKGFESEVQALFERRDLHEHLPSIRCVGYRQIWSYLEGKINHKEMVYRGICATRQLAKRQCTWLKGWKNVHWLDSNHPNLAVKKVLQVFNKTSDKNFYTQN